MPNATSQSYAAIVASPVGLLGIRVHAGEFVAIDEEWLLAHEGRG